MPRNGKATRAQVDARFGHTGPAQQCRFNQIDASRAREILNPQIKVRETVVINPDKRARIRRR